MQDAVSVGTGAMAAVFGLDADKVAQACEEASDGEVVSPANLNGGGQVVIAGARAAVARAGERARALGAKRDRKSVVEGKRGSVSVDLGGTRLLNKKNHL